MRRMKRKSLLVFCISAAVVFTFPNTVHAETINGFTRQNYLTERSGLPPADWKESGMYQDVNGETYWVGKYDEESDRRTVSTGDKLGYADANMNMVIPLTVKWDKWDTIEDFYKGRAMTNDKVQEIEASGKWNVYDTKYLIDVNGNELNKIKLKRHYSYSEKTDTVITSNGDKYFAGIAGFDKPKESTGIDVEVIKYSDGSYYNYFYSFADYPFLIDRYKEEEHGNELMLTDFDETGVAKLYCRDTSSWGYHTPIGLGDSGWGYKKNIVLGKISIWGSVFEK